MDLPRPLRTDVQKKSAHANEQDRPDILKRREDWFDGQLDLDPQRLVFIDETWTSTNMARRYGRAPPVVIDRLTGEIRKAQIFVAVLGASSFTFAHASWTQALPDWIDAHVRALEAIGGVPHLLVPDNTKTAVIKACLYDPQVNRTYAEMAAHYGTVIPPARPRRPRDKAKVEQAVLIVERWLLGRLRHRTFFSLADVNAAIADLMTHLNEERPIRRLGVTRRQLLEQIDRPALKVLPAEPYEFSEWRTCRGGIDYHIDVAAHYYRLQRAASLRPRRS
jgi:hypothetical protein